MLKSAEVIGGDSLVLFILLHMFENKRKMMVLVEFEYVILTCRGFWGMLGPQVLLLL